MSSLALEAAESALSLKSGLPGLDSKPAGTLKGRAVTHWSYKLFIAGSVVGAIAALAAFIMGWNAAGFLGILLCVIGGGAAFYVKRFSVLNTLEDYTRALAEKVKALAEKTLELKQINQDIEDINKEFQKIPKNWREEIKYGERRLAERTVELEKVTKKLQVAEKRLEKLALVTNQLQEETGKLTTAALEFSKENNFFGNRVEKLDGHVKELNQQHEGFQDKITRLDEENDQTEEVMNIYAKQNKVLKDLFKLMKEMYVKAKERMGELESKVGELSIVVPQAVASTDKVEEMARELEGMVKKIEKQEKYKEGYKRWKTWVKSPDFKEYMEWRKATNNGGLR